MFEYLQESYHAFLRGDDDLKAQLEDDMLQSFKVGLADILLIAFFSFYTFAFKNNIFQSTLRKKEYDLL